LGDTAMCHLAATVRDPYPVDAEGHLWFESTPFAGGLTLKEGKAILPNRPGLGVELDEEQLESMLVSK
jgi:L-alanine-DL-glutamate epimerase-like enolase superfamily enzyme